MAKEFKNWVHYLASEYKRTQSTAFHKVDYELCNFHIILGKEIEETSFKNTYGSKFYNVLSEELKKELPNSRGFSPRNLRYIQSFYILYRKILQQLVAKFTESKNDQQIDVVETDIHNSLIDNLALLPWGHYVVIMDYCKNDTEKAYFYVTKAIQERCSRNELSNLMYSKTYEREGNSINNFPLTLEGYDSTDIKKISKDPYRFNLLGITEDYKERELNDALVNDIERTLVELGRGYSFVAKEYRIEVGESEFYIDLLFYYIPLHSYVVIEVKNTKFKPEFLGQLNFYVNAIDKNLRIEGDNKTIGILLCKEKDNNVVQYSLNGFEIPIGVSTFDINEILPKDFKSELPTIEELEKDKKNNQFHIRRK